MPRADINLKCLPPSVLDFASRIVIGCLEIISFSCSNQVSNSNDAVESNSNSVNLKLIHHLNIFEAMSDGGQIWKVNPLLVSDTALLLDM